MGGHDGNRARHLTGAPWPIEETEILEVADFAARVRLEPTEANLECLEAGGLVDRIGPDRVRASTRILAMWERAQEFEPPPQMLIDAVTGSWRCSARRQIADTNRRR